jgi:iron complex outermembrane receptor protein
MKRTGRRAAVALLLAFGLAVSAPAAAAIGEVSGTVKDSTGGVLVGASVALRNSAGATVQTASTDARGRYRLAPVAPGSYTIFVHKDGFAALNDEFRVTDNGAEKDVTLAPASFSEEVTVSFTGEQARTALKMEAAVKDIPLTVKSYTSSFVKALDVKTVNEMYTYMNGINRTGDGVYDTSIRGFTSAQEANNMQVNGMPGFAARQTAPSISNVERIEVLKGPASVLYGRATPGGLVNIVTKRPQAQRQHTIDLRGGTFGGGHGPGFGDENSYRVGVDLTGPLGKSTRVLYRLIGSYDNIRSFRDFVHDTDLLVAPSLAFNISDGTILTLEGEYRDLDKSLDQQLIAPLNDINFLAPINVRYQEPGDKELDKGTVVAANLAKLFSGGVMLNANWRSVFHEDIRRGLENNRVEADNRRVRRRDRDQLNKRHYHFLDTTLSKTFKSGSMSHNVLFGFGGGYEDRDFDRIRFNNLGFFIDLYQPVYGRYTLPANPNPGFHRLQKLWNYNAYLQDRVDFGEKVKALLALRYDRLETDFEELRLADPDRSRMDDAVVPTVGLVFQPTNRISLYGSFATSFEPQAVTSFDASGQSPFEPEKGRQFEGGAKGEFAGGKAEATLAVFHIERENVLVQLTSGAFEQVGKERSQGFELDVRLQPRSNFQTILGYTYTDAKVLEDRDPLKVGAQLINSAKHAFNVWGRYDVASGAARGLGFGVGVIFRDYRPGSFPNQVVRTGEPVPGQPVASRVVDLPRYFRADAGVYYVKSRYELTLKVNNVFDELYYESAFNLLQVRPGRPREVTMSLRVGL